MSGSLMKWALQVLSVVQKEYPDAVIAGGFLRDLELDLIPNDLDIFVPQEGGQEKGYITFEKRARKLTTALFDETLINKGKVLVNTFYDGLVQDAERPLIGVASYDTVKDEAWLMHPPIQIIALDSHKFSLEKVINDFDISICQIGHDGWCLRKSPYFDDDVALQRLTIHRSRNFLCFQRTAQRLTKLLHRLPFRASDGVSDMWSIWTKVDPVTGEDLADPMPWRMSNED